MGARASRRRHEGRRIRKMRRQLGLITRGFEEMADAMTVFGNAVMRAMSSLSELAQCYEMIDLGIPGLVAMRDTRDGTVTVGVDPGLPYPTQSGVEELRTAATASAEMRGFEIDPRTIIVDEFEVGFCADDCPVCAPLINPG